MKYAKKELDFIVDRIDKNLYEYSEWEQSFFNSIKSQLGKGWILTSKQQEILSKLWDKLEEV